MKEELFLQKLGKNIRRIRKEKGIRQVELGLRCDFDKQTMHRIEAGKTNPTTLTLKKIAEALEVSFQDLFSFEKDKK